MDKRSGDIKWLNKRNHEWKWAYRYMVNHANENLYSSIQYAANNRNASYDVICDIVNYLQETDAGCNFITRLRGALRQHRYRSVENGRVSSTFTLPVDAKVYLKAVAQKTGASESSVIVDLLNNAEKLIREHRNRERKIKSASEAKLNRARRRIKILEAKHHEAMREIERLAKLSSTWELALEEEFPNIPVDQDALDHSVAKKVSDSKKVIQRAAKKAEILNPLA